MNERERIEREAAAAARAWYWADSHDRTRVEPESMSGLVSAMTALVLRERAAALESATKAIEGLPRFHLMRDTDSGCCHASMLGVTDDGPWISRSDAIDALAVQERAQ